MLKRGDTYNRTVDPPELNDESCCDCDVVCALLACSGVAVIPLDGRAMTVQ